MVYSNAMYFASYFDKLTKVLSTFNENQKSQKNTNQGKIKLAKSLFALRRKGHPEELG